MRTFGFAALVLLLLSSCSDSRAVNAAFAQTKVSWFVFDPGREDGLQPVGGFEEARRVVWLPRDRAVFATDVAAAPGVPGAAAVTGLGLLILDDTDGTLRSARPLAQTPLEGYRTGRLFTWKDRLFVTLSTANPLLPPATLAWWQPGQTRVAFYPVPSQIREPSRQALSVLPPVGDVIEIRWKEKRDSWRYLNGTFNLATGEEGEAAPERQAPESEADFEPLRARLAEKVGLDAPSQAVRGPQVLAVFSESGWVAIGRAGEGRARLYRLPDLGVAGRYTRGAALARGFVFTWETAFRAHVGASGLVHAPFGVLAP